MMSSYYTPPPSSGSQWTQPLMLPPHRPPSANHQPNAQLLPHATPDTNHAPYAALMMQQMMQNYPFNMSQQQPFAQHAQPQQQHVPTPVFDQHEMRTPQASDNLVLAQTIFESTKRGLTYKAALESLHGHNGIMAFAWKDYFLENKQTIDALVDTLSGQAPSSSNVLAGRKSPNTALNNGSGSSPIAERKPDHPRLKSEDTKSRASEERSASVPTRRGKSKESTPTRVVKIRSEKETNGKAKRKSSENRGDTPSRRTLNSLSSAPSNDLLAKIPPAVAIDERTGLPAAPSRSPSPPPAGPNSRYTEQDTIFFFRRIAYDLARHPELSKAGLCEILGQKAPHHSALSWRTFWHKHEDVADKLNLLTQLDEEDREAVIQSWKGSTSVHTVNARSRTAATRRVSYRESSDSEINEETDSESSASESEDESSASSDGDDDSDAQGSTDEEGRLGEAGSVFSIAEKRVLAKHIASCPEWFTGKREWESFFVAYPQRTSAAWREYYRRKGDEIDALARKYMRKAKKGNRTRISAQRGRPSWARQNNTAAVINGSAPIKRKLSEGGLREQSEEKRTKKEEDA